MLSARGVGVLSKILEMCIPQVSSQRGSIELRLRRTCCERVAVCRLEL